MKEECRSRSDAQHSPASISLVRQSNASRTKSIRSSGISSDVPPGNRTNTDRRGIISTAADADIYRLSGCGPPLLRSAHLTRRCQYRKRETDTPSRRQNSDGVRPVGLYRTNLRCQSANFCRSRPRPTKSLLRRRKRSIG